MKNILFLLAATLVSAAANAQVTYERSTYSASFIRKGTAIIPNLYKSKRHGHLTGAAAAWSNTDLAGVQAERFKEHNKNDGQDAFKSDHKGFGAFVYGGNDQVYGELAISRYKFDVEEFNPYFQQEEKSRISRLQGGMRSTTGRNTFGVRISNFEEEFGVNDFEQAERAISFSQKLDDGTYIGGYVANVDNKYVSSSEDDDFFAFGFGKVIGDEAKPDLAGEAYLSYANEESDKTYQLIGRVLTNIGDIQYSADATLFRVHGNSFDTLTNQKTAVVNVGADVSFGEFYIAPELGALYADQIQAYWKSRKAVLEGGYRNAGREFFLQVRRDATRGHNTGGGTIEDRNDSRTATIGFNSEF